MWTSILFSALLLTISISMLSWHLRVARTVALRAIAAHERDYLRRQSRRRTQASGIMGLLGVMVLGSLWIEGIVFSAIYWATACALVAWMCLLALADMMDTRYHFRRLRKQQLAEQAELCSQLKRIKSREGNGRHADGSQGTGSHETT
jgi:hypothetical protein